MRLSDTSSPILTVLLLLFQNISWAAESMRKDIVLQGHDGPITHASFSPDSQKIVSASYDKSVKIWDANNGALIAEIVSPGNPYNNVCFDTSGHGVITSKDDRVDVWDASTGQWLRQVSKSEDCPKNITSPDGEKIMTLAATGSIIVLDSITGDQLCTLAYMNSRISRGVFFLSDEILTISSQGSVDLWNARNGEHIRNLVKTTSVNLIAISHDRKKLLVVSRKNNIRLRLVKSQGSL